MARKPREMSATGVYHVCLRGVNKQRIFEYPEDYEGFFRILRQAMLTDKNGQQLDEPNFEIYAYCLMDNHVHLLLGTQKISIGEIVKRVAGSYAQFFNWRYKRVGHLFQDRFRSEACTNSSYFYTLLEYIHMNPVKAGICASPDKYKYSSYSEISGKNKGENLCSFNPNIEDVTEQTIRDWVSTIHIPQSNMSDDPYASVRKIISEQYYDLRHLTAAGMSKEDESLLARFTHWGQTLLCNLFQAKQDNASAEELDKLIVETLLGLSGAASISEFQRLEKRAMRGVLAQVRDAGISIRRLSRISGISEGIIRGCKNPQNQE